jgi:hypothetical protein
MTVFWFGTKSYPTKKAAKVFLSTFLKTHPRNQPLNEQELSWALPLFERHPRGVEKLANLKNVVVAQNGSHASFVIEYKNGTRDDISYTKCLTPTENDKHVRSQAALRVAIRNDITAFRNDAFSNGKQVSCAFCDAPLTNSFESYVDHISSARPFCGLVYDFLREKNLNLESLKVNSMPYGMLTHQELDDKAFEAEWVAYHKEHARLQMVCRGCNSADAIRAKRAKT